MTFSQCVSWECLVVCFSKGTDSGARMLGSEPWPRHFLAVQPWASHFTTLLCLLRCTTENARMCLPGSCEDFMRIALWEHCIKGQYHYLLSKIPQKSWVKLLTVYLHLLLLFLPLINLIFSLIKSLKIIISLNIF